MLTVKITGSEELQRKLAEKPDAVHRALLQKVWRLTLRLEAHVKNDKLSGQVLHTITGRLKRSIRSDVVEKDAAVVGKVFVGADVPYAAIHEFGGRTSPHEILPVKAKALAFMMDGKQVFAKRVNHPGSVMPERSYLRSALGDMREEIIAELVGATREALQ